MSCVVIMRECGAGNELKIEGMVINLMSMKDGKMGMVVNLMDMKDGERMIALCMGMKEVKFKNDLGCMVWVVVN